MSGLQWRFMQADNIVNCDFELRRVHPYRPPPKPDWHLQIIVDLVIMTTNNHQQYVETNARTSETELQWWLRKAYPTCATEICQIYFARPPPEPDPMQLQLALDSVEHPVSVEEFRFWIMIASSRSVTAFPYQPPTPHEIQLDALDSEMFDCHASVGEPNHFRVDTSVCKLESQFLAVSTKHLWFQRELVSWSVHMGMVMYPSISQKLRVCLVSAEEDDIWLDADYPSRLIMESSLPESTSQLPERIMLSEDSFEQLLLFSRRCRFQLRYSLSVACRYRQQMAHYDACHLDCWRNAPSLQRESLVSNGATTKNKCIEQLGCNGCLNLVQTCNVEFIHDSKQKETATLVQGRTRGHPLHVHAYKSIILLIGTLGFLGPPSMLWYLTGYVDNGGSYECMNWLQKTQVHLRKQKYTCILNYRLTSVPYFQKIVFRYTYNL